MTSSDSLSTAATSTAAQHHRHNEHDTSTLSIETMRKGMVLRKSSSEGDVNKKKRDDRLVVWLRKMAAESFKRDHHRNNSDRRLLQRTGVAAAWGRKPPAQSAASHCCCIGQEVPPEIEELDTIFHPRFQHYSPQQGLIFRCNGFVDDLYPTHHHHGLTGTATRKHEPVAELTRQLFYRTSEGHVALRPYKGSHSRLGAHLSAGMVGEILECMEVLKNSLVRSTNRHNPQMIQEDLSQRLAAMIGMHNDYKWVRKQLEEQVHKAQVHLIAAENTLAESASRHHDPMSSLEASSSAHHSYHHSHSTTTTSRPRLNALMAKQNLRTAQDALQHEAEERMKLANNLAASFLAHELGYGGLGSSDLPKFSTIALLLAQMWYERGDGSGSRSLFPPESLEGYLKAMSRLGALTCPLAEALRMIRAPSTSLTEDPRRASAAPPSSRSWKRRSRKASSASTDSSRKSNLIRPPRAPAA